MMKKIMILCLVFLFLFVICSCSGEDSSFVVEYEANETEDEEKSTNYVIAGNEPNNTVFWNNVICEDETYVYVSSYMYVGLENINSNIIKINKNDGSVTDSGLRGHNLSIYNNYLYFVDIRNFLYRLDLDDPEIEPELVSDAFIYTYIILNSKVYPSGFLNVILSMNLDGLDIEPESGSENKYIICGYDDKYIYALYEYDIDTIISDGRETHIQYLTNMDSNHDNREKLFKIHTDHLTPLGTVNNFMIISKGYAYYTIRYDSRDEIVRNRLALNSEKEIIYRAVENEAIYITAVTDDGIYLQKYDIGDCIASSNPRHPNTKLSLDGKTESQVDLEKKKDLLFFVSRFDNKLYYVEDSKIFPLEP
jgi:hypothetical protein